MEQPPPLRWPLILHHLPEEIIEYILLWLPVKSLVRFRCVCKRWRSLLSGDREFSACYLHRRHGYLIKLEKSSSWDLCRYAYLMYEDELLDRKVVQIQLPPHTVVQNQNDLDSDMEVIGSIDGILCIYNSFANSSVLWNPATRQFHHTPNPHILPSPGSASFGFARINGDCTSSFFKVVIICRYSCYRCSLVVQGEVYDSRTDTWTLMANPPNLLTFYDFRCNAIVNGVPYWRGLDRSNNFIIISFDPVANEFRQFKGPELEFGFGDEVVNQMSWNLGEIEECLVAFAPGLDKSVQVWKMVEDDGGGSTGQVVWTKQFKLGPVDGVKRWVRCWKDGEFLVDSEFYSYESKRFGKMNLWDSRNKQIRVFPDLPNPAGFMPQDASVFTETLVPPRHHCQHLGESGNGVEGESSGNEVEGESNGNEGKPCQSCGRGPRGSLYYVRSLWRLSRHGLNAGL